MMPTIDRMPTMDTPRALRSLKPGVSVGDVARGTGITVSHVSRVFNGRRRPSLAYAQRIADYLNVTLDDLTAAIYEAAATTPSSQAA